MVKIGMIMNDLNKFAKANNQHTINRGLQRFAKANNQHTINRGLQHINQGLKQI